MAISIDKIVKDIRKGLNKEMNRDFLEPGEHPTADTTVLNLLTKGGMASVFKCSQVISGETSEVGRAIEVLVERSIPLHYLVLHERKIDAFKEPGMMQYFSPQQLEEEQEALVSLVRSKPKLVDKASVLSAIQEKGINADIGLAAVKYLSKRYAMTYPAAFLREKFMREKSIISSLGSHSNIPNFKAAFESPKGWGYVMEFIEGMRLDQILRDTRRIGPEKGIEAHFMESGSPLPAPQEVAMIVMYQIAQGLEYCQDQHIPVIHNDIKPNNVIVSLNGDVKIIDFGISTRQGERLIELENAEANRQPSPDTIGITLHYASPELASYEMTTPKSDIFSLAILTYELLTGQRPFNESGVFDSGDKLITQIKSAKARKLRRLDKSIPPWIETLVHACLNKKPSSRPSPYQIMHTIEKNLYPNHAYRALNDTVVKRGTKIDLDCHRHVLRDFITFAQQTHEAYPQDRVDNSEDFATGFD